MSIGYITSGKPDYNVPGEEPVICILNKEKKPGVLKFIGETKFSSGVWCGIALREPCGKNDGSVAGVRYFECDEHHGIFVTPKNVFHDKAEDELKPLEITPVMREPPSITLDQQEYEISDCSFDEGRPRSKSDAVINEKKNAASLFSNSPFKCNIRNAKSSSLSKLNNLTYICSSPFLPDTDNKNLFEPRHSSPLVSSHNTSREVCDGQNNEHLTPSNVPNKLHHHSDLSPKFEVKKSIKLGSINSARFPAPAALGKDGDYKLNKTFLVRKESLGVAKKDELGTCNQASETRSGTDSNERSANNDDQLKQETVVSSTNQESLNITFVSNNESEGENGRPRSVSKSSWSSMESLASVGSTKSNNERIRSSGTKTPRKLPCPTECSRSRLVKISAEKKHTSKVMDKEIARSTRGKQISKSASKPVAKELLATKSRTKSTSVVAPRSVLATPSASKSTLKQKSKSVSSDFRDGQPQSRTRLNSSKFATPLASKISAQPTSRLTSTPLSKKSTFAETKPKSSTAGASSQTTSSNSLSGICENEPRNMSRENSNVESKLLSLQAKNKQSSSSMSVNKEKETKPVVSKSKNLSASTTSKENKTLSAKTRALSTSAASKEYKAIASRSRNLSASCNNKEEIKPPLSKLRNISRAEGGSTKNIGLKSSIKSPAVCSVSDKLPTSSKSLPQPRRAKPGEQLSFKERQNSGELVKKRPVKEKPETTNTELRSCLNSAATPDILKQTPEVTRHSIAVQVDTLEETTHERSTEEQRKADALLAAFVQRNREFEACLVALQVYVQKVDQECENASLLRKNLKYTRERYYSTENMLVKESSQRAYLEEEMLSARSDSVVEVALLRAQYERKQEVMQTKMKESHKKDLEKVRKQHMKSLEDVKHTCDLKLKRIEETYVEDIAQLNEKHRDVIAELELQHSKNVDDLVEERHAEIETIKEDYDEQVERMQENLSKSAKKCSELEEKLRISEEEAKRDIELRIQDAVTKYKSLPDELESMKFVLEMKNNEVKKLRRSNDELQNQIDELMRIKERAALLEREKESLNYVVENKGYLERKLSLERDKLRLSLDREVATSKRLSLEKEELAWRLNSFHNSPTSPIMSTDRFNWRMSGFNSPDSAVYSQKIEESDFEYQINDTKEIES